MRCAIYKDVTLAANEAVVARQFGADQSRSPALLSEVIMSNADHLSSGLPVLRTSMKGLIPHAVRIRQDTCSWRGGPVHAHGLVSAPRPPRAPVAGDSRELCDRRSRRHRAGGLAAPTLHRRRISRTSHQTGSRHTRVVCAVCHQTIALTAAADRFNDEDGLRPPGDPARASPQSTPVESGPSAADTTASATPDPHTPANNNRRATTDATPSDDVIAVGRRDDTGAVTVKNA